MTALANAFEPTTVSSDHRLHGRVKVTLPGRFMRANRQEYACMTTDMSPGGVAFVAEEAVDFGERIVVYLEQLGRLEGRVVRLFEGGFAITMKLPVVKRERLADQLTWLANRTELGLPEDRLHERIRPNQIRTTLILPQGREVIAVIVDVSRSGVALTFATPVRTSVGVPVTVGATPGRIVRLLANGVAVEFSRVIPEEAFGVDVTL